MFVHDSPAWRTGVTRRYQAGRRIRAGLTLPPVSGRLASGIYVQTGRRVICTSVVERLLDADGTTQVAGLVAHCPVMWVQGLQLGLHRLRYLPGTAMTDDTLARTAPAGQGTGIER